MINPAKITSFVLVITSCVGAVARRTCGTKSKTDEEKSDIEAKVSEYLARYKPLPYDDEIVVNVYWHIITTTSGQRGDTSDETIEKTIDIMNDAFGGIPSNYSECSDAFTYESFPASPFRFELKEIKRHKCTLAFYLLSPISAWFRRRKRVGNCSDLNIFTGTSVLLGSSTYAVDCPCDGDFRKASKSDSVTINYRSLPGGSFAAYNQGDTAVHEVGHWFGLYHTFEGGCSDGDLVQDTAPERDATPGCPVGKDTCPSEGEDPIHNFMDYADDCCMYRFTQGQIDRMVDQARTFRGFWAENATAEEELY